MQHSHIRPRCCFRLLPRCPGWTPFLQVLSLLADLPRPEPPPQRRSKCLPVGASCSARAQNSSSRSLHSRPPRPTRRGRRESQPPSRRCCPYRRPAPPVKRSRRAERRPVAAVSSPRCSGGPPSRRLHWVDRTRVAVKPWVWIRSDLRACADAGAGRSRSCDRCHRRGPKHLPRSWVSSSGESSWWCQCGREAGRGGQRVTITPFLDQMLRSVTPPIRTLPFYHQCEAFKRAKSTSDAISGLRRRPGKGKQKRVFLLRPSTPQNINTIHNLTTGPLTSLPDCGGSSSFFKCVSARTIQIRVNILCTRICARKTADFI